MNEAIVDLTAENAQSIIQASLQTLTVVIVWSPRSEDSLSQVQVLEALCQEYAGHFILAKVNADTDSMLASQFGVRSIPTVMIIQNGQPIDGGSGEQSEDALRTMVGQYLPKLWDTAMEQGLALLVEGNHTDALPILKSAYEESGQLAPQALAYGQCLLHVKRFDEVKAIVDSIKMVDQNADYEQLKAQLELAQEAARSPEIEALAAEYKQAPTPENAYKLAIQYSQESMTQEALGLLYDVLRTNLNYADGQAKKTFMDILAALGKGDPLAAEYQRKLFTLMY